jgi:uncharacterized membrane protein YqiK
MNLFSFRKWCAVWQTKIDKLRVEEAELRESVSSLQTKYLQEDLKFQKQCSAQTADYEHEFHSGMQERQVILAKLDAEVEYKKSLVENHAALHKALLDEKDKTIALLTDLVKKLADKDIVVK